MGIYIKDTTKGRIVNLKAANILAELINDGAEPIKEPKEWQDNLVCLVNNGSFGAAAYAYNEAEMDYFKQGYNGRDHVWLLYPNAKEFAQ